MTRVFGRITWFGEYLMHETTEGLVTPCGMYISDDPVDPRHPWYSPAEDSIRLALERQGYSPAGCVRGTLPLSFGLAGSTALGMLHLASTPPAIRDVLLHALDHRTHGFVPSGVDFESITRQSAGFFSVAGWRDVGWNSPSFGLIGFEKESEHTPDSIRRLIEPKRAPLDRLARRLRTVIHDRGLFIQALVDYCSILHELNVYSTAARLFIARMLDRGLPAKGIGGLYDKAVLVVVPEGECAVVTAAASSPEVVWSWASDLNGYTFLR